MATSAAFDLTSELLQAEARMDALAARGTVRLALKSAGLDAASVTGPQMCAVLANLLPDHLARHGVADPSAACARIEQRVKKMNEAAKLDGADRAAAVFERFGR